AALPGGLPGRCAADLAQLGLSDLGAGRSPRGRRLPALPRRRLPKGRHGAARLLRHQRCPALDRPGHSEPDHRPYCRHHLLRTGTMADSILSRGISRYQYFLAKLHARLVSVIGTFFLLGVLMLVGIFFFLQYDLSLVGCLIALLSVAVM